MNLKKFDNKIINVKFFILFLLVLNLTACVTTPPPADVNNVCHIFKQYPKWYADSKDVERRWKIPVPVQMAIIHQESKFSATARPPRTRLLWVIPWKHQSSAYGYAQALRATWAQYKHSDGGVWSSRDNFGDGVDFIGWYANQAYMKARILRTDVYNLYLAYHEGIGGYQRKTYLKKSWLISVARKVKARSQQYAVQLNSCKASLSTRRTWF